MTPRLQATRAAIELIKRFEGYRRVAARLDDGRWTIGFGHTKTARQGAEVSEADAEALLIYDLMEITAKLNDWIFTPVTQNQFDAMAAFAFNIGLDNFRHSLVLRRINEGALLRAAFAMELWRRADFEGHRIIIDALVRRRAAEKMLFLTPENGFLPAPSAVLAPRLDHEGPSVAPAHTPVEVRTPMEGERAVAERVGPIPALRPVPPEEEEPSASQVAAEALSARLQSILQEPGEPSAPASRQAPPETAAEPPPSPTVEAAAAETFALSPPPEAAPPALDELSRPPVEGEPLGAEEPELFGAAPITFEQFEEDHAASQEYEPIDAFGEIEPERSAGPMPLLMALGVLGLVLFSAGLFWIVSAKHAADGGLLSNPMIVGGGLGVVGIGCVASAVYFLLERLGGREEP